VVDPSVSNEEQTPPVSRAKDLDLPERLWTYDDFKAVEAMPVDFTAGLASLAFIRAAIRRSTRFCYAMALVGLLIGLAIYHEKPPAYQASTSVLITYGPFENISSAPADNQAIVQSRAVAALAMHRLGLQESVSSFLAAYTATPLSNRVLVIAAKAPSSNEAVSWANAVAKAFLNFRDGQLKQEQNIALAAVDQQLNSARQKVRSLDRQINQAFAQGASPGRQQTLARLRTERSQAASAVSTLEQSGTGSPTRAATTLAIKGSTVLDAATPTAHSRLKSLIFYAIIGLILGLVLAVGIVVVRALVSDRLRRRDDVAHALGAPVAVSAGTVRRRRLLPGPRGLAAAEHPDIRRIAAYMAKADRAGARGTTALAVVPVDDPYAPALSLASLAMSCAEQRGLAVVMTDLCTGAPAARLFGITGAGVEKVSVPGGQLVVAVSERGDIAPSGPLERTSSQARLTPFAEAVAAASSSADLLLTLAPLDPELGGEYLSTWATTAIAFVTAGESSATRIHAVGEMIRLAGVTLDSAVLIGADRTDESLGMARASSTTGYHAAEPRRPRR
jgi:capsular polysaccharide biosynthesis protein